MLRYERRVRGKSIHMVNIVKGTILSIKSYLLSY